MPVPCVSTDTTQMILGSQDWSHYWDCFYQSNLFCTVFHTLWIYNIVMSSAGFEPLFPEGQDKESAQFCTNSGSQQFDTFVQVMVMCIDRASVCQKSVLPVFQVERKGCSHDIFPLLLNFLLKNIRIKNTSDVSVRGAVVIWSVTLALFLITSILLLPLPPHPDGWDCTRQRQNSADPSYNPAKVQPFTKTQ